MTRKNPAVGRAPTVRGAQIREELVPENDPYPLPSEPTIWPVTPAMASSWLSYRNHAKNRPLSKGVAARYQRDIEAGRWREATPEGLIFDTDGFGISFQHRMKALANVPEQVLVEKYGAPALRFWVFPDEPRDVFEFIDQGFRRTPAHLLRVPYATSLAAGARHLAALADGDLWGMPRYNSITTPEVVKAFHAWPELEWYGTDLFAVWHNARVPMSPHAAVLAQAARTEHRNKIESWLEGLKTGYDLGRGDPRVHLRNRFHRGLQTLSQMTKRDYAYAVIVKAWNAYAADTPLTSLRHAANEVLPVVEGFSFEEKGNAA